MLYVMVIILGIYIPIKNHLESKAHPLRHRADHQNGKNVPEIKEKLNGDSFSDLFYKLE